MKNINNIPDAVYSSIEKWARIRAGIWPLQKANSFCGLCYYSINKFIQEDNTYTKRDLPVCCKLYCPLHELGENCLDIGSIVNKLYSSSAWMVYSKEPNRNIKLADKMLELLHQIRREHQ